jgi:copper chaperone CopZ
MRMILRQAAVALAVVLLTIAAAAEPRSYTLTVEGLVCQLCAYSAKRNLSAIEGVEQVEVDHRTGEATVTMVDGAVLDEAEARHAIDAAGFTLLGFESLESSPQE